MPYGEPPGHPPAGNIGEAFKDSGHAAHTPTPPYMAL